MKIELWGSGRHVRDIELINDDISQVRPPSENDGRIKGPTSFDEIVIRGSATNLNLHGNYEVGVRLNKREIAGLVKIAFGNDTYTDVIEAMSKGEAAP